MNFFKHFTDSHEGTTLTTLFKEMGHMGPSCYWTLTEICVKKLEKGDAEEFTGAHCHFRFHESILRKKLRVSSKNLQKFLRICSELSQVFSTFSGEIIEIDFPKILESLDRDSRRARPERGHGAPKSKSNNKKEIETAFLNWHEAAVKVRVAYKKYGNWSESEAEVRHELGDTVFEIARRAGVHRMRMLSDNPFTIRDIASMLKEANQQLQLKEAR